MNADQIKISYPNEWVLVEYEELDDSLRVKKGHVLKHSPNKDEILSALSHTCGKDVTIEYTGSVNNDLTVMFFLLG